ncbi:hypothetical protein L7F22_059927 [Adiantum nelumboides]|nr:hypothetical protein [Adiantum nelumboides]
MMQEQNNLLGRKLESRQHQLDLKEEQLKRAWRHKKLIEQSIMSKYLLQTLQDISTPQGNITLKIADAQQWMNRIRTDLEDKAETVTEALVNEAVVSYLGDLDNKSDEENDDDDEDKDEEDNEDPAGTSGHQGPDDDDNDDANLLGTGPSGGASTDPPPPSTFHTDPPASTGTDDHSHDTGAAGGQQDTTALVTYKKRSAAIVSSISKETAISNDLVPSTSKEMAISTMVSSTGAEMAKSTAMVPSSKGKEKAIIGSTDSFNVANPWLYKEFRLAKQLQLKEYLQADDMHSDMKRLADLYSGVMQVANSWKSVQYHDRTKCALSKHPTVIQVLDRVQEITVDSTVKDVNPRAKQLTTDKIRSVGLQVEMLLGHKPQYECIQEVRNSIRDGLSQLKSARDTWDQKLQRILDFSTSSSTLSHKPMTIEYQEKNIKNMIHVIRIVEQIGDWWEKAEGLWKEWITVINEVEQKKTVKECRTSVGEFKAGMRSWKRHMQHAYCLSLLSDYLKPGSTVLDVGSGSGYLTAVFAIMVGENGRAVGVEHIPELVQRSIEAIKKGKAAHLLESGKLSIHASDGKLGYPDGAPYDAIHVGAAAAVVPKALMAQLKPGGRMVIPVGQSLQDLMVIDKQLDGSVKQHSQMGVRYVPLV